MKISFLFLLLTPVTCFSQKFALIDKKLKIPILYSDSVTVEQLNKGFFPVENTSIDTLVANIKYLREMIEVRQRSKMKSFELRSSNVVIKTARVPFAYGDRYSSLMLAEANGLTAEFNLIDNSQKNKRSAERLEAILKYFKSNKSFFKEPNEIHPKFYNVVVIVD